MKVRSPIRLPVSLSSCESLLEEYFWDSIDAPSSFPTFEHAMNIGAPRSAEALQYGPADSEHDLNKIGRHRIIRRALQTMLRTNLYWMSFYFADWGADLQIHHSFGRLSHLVIKLLPIPALKTILAKPKANQATIAELKTRAQTIKDDFMIDFHTQLNKDFI